MANATARPWKCVSEEGKMGVDIRGNDGRAVAATFGVCNCPKTSEGARKQADEDRANARLIVAAVNAYAPMVAALEEAAEHLYTTQDIARVREQARAALALARKDAE